MSKVDLGHAVDLAPKEAVEYFRSKGYAVSEDWHDTWQDAHNRAFTVAKAAKMEVLKVIRSHVEKTLAEGKTMRQAVDELKPALIRQGWWGEQEITKKDNTTEKYNVGVRRLRTIINTNIQTAYAAGRYSRQMETTKAFPYLQYVAVLDGATRASHRAMSGKVFAANDPIWDAIYPPNGFNCRCRVQSISKRRLEKSGRKVESSEGRLRTVNQDIISKRTGVAHKKPRGKEYSWTDKSGRKHAFTPDPGWSYNPGKGFASWINPNDNPVPGKSEPTWKQLGRPSIAKLPAEKIKLPKNMPEGLDGFKKAVGMKGDETVRVKTPVDDVLITETSLRKIADASSRDQFAHMIKPALERPNEIYLVYHGSPGKQGEYRKRYIKKFDEDGVKRPVLLVVEQMPDGRLITFIPQSSRRHTHANKPRQGRLLYFSDKGE